MTIDEVIERVDERKPNAFSGRDKAEWLSALDGRIAANVFLWPPAEFGALRYTYPDDGGRVLLIDPPHDDIYVYWLMAKIDEANGEYNKYQNTMQTYNELYGDFVRWFAGLYDPAQGYDRRRYHGIV